ncbi:aminopeptidase P family protein [Labrys monachus]|uniref:Xaa-Pro aminopeptidase n=1 Tax=Labrys monachus TaxID=217067 RepID=A0ABU0FKW0_9HYPH|nr:aminopeptidase P family protein [Labrys monachus]MDQ0395248.1 Xaa-Pro aminopeptidase [Labrys monachus]
MTTFQSFDEISQPALGPARVKALREKLAERGLDGFVVPRSDEHQNEYCPPSEERLAWLTGFAGSAGIAIVLAAEAAIFVDGRYTVQVREQVDTGTFTPRHLVEEPPERWLERTLAPGARLGYDPRLQSINEVERLRAACEKAGAALVPVEDNPVDAIWADRPAPPLASIVLHDVSLAGESSGSKIERLQAKLAEQKIDAVFTNDAHACAWLFNIRGGDVSHTPLPLSYALVPASGEPTLFVDGRKLSNAVRDNLSHHMAIAEPGRMEAVLAAEVKGKTVRLDPTMVVERFATLVERAGGKVQKGSDPIALMRAVKNEAEQAGARAAHIRDGAAFVSFLAWFDRTAPEGTETEISTAEALEHARSETGVLKDLSFPTISAAGPNAAIPHYRVSRASNRPVTPGLFLIDSGAQYVDGTTDITRTIAVGDVTPLMRDRYTRVLKGHIAIAQVRFPKGASGSQLDSFARAALWEVGTDFDHGTGHGVGSYLSVHEGPQRISKLGTTPLEPGMILSNEPGYYRAGEFGIRIENLVLVEAVEIEGAERPMQGFETLTLAPIDTRPIDVGLLTRSEIDWLDAYHRRVREVLSPLVEPDERDWLERATAPIG